MTASARSYGKVFDEIAAEYDRNRPMYPDELVDQAGRVAGIGDGDQVLEIGCGSGQLTRSLAARGWHVTAVEPGANLIALARQNLEGAGAVEFMNARFEDAPCSREHFRAVFSASALHWVDPKVSWRKIADALVPGGTLALLSYFGLEEQRSKHDQEAVFAAVRKVVPDVAASWPAYRDLDATLAGVDQRRENVSAVWAWLGSYHDLAQDYASRLFGNVQVAVVPKLVEQTADELNAVLRTMSFYARLSPDQRQDLERENAAIYARLGRPVRASVVVTLVTAQRNLRRTPPPGPVPVAHRPRRLTIEAAVRVWSCRPASCVTAAAGTTPSGAECPFATQNGAGVT
jgi:ubiquinone/menaquinone biosynthesis C-methylase UbiE